MVNMGELFANRRIGNIVMDRVPLTESDIKKVCFRKEIYCLLVNLWFGLGQANARLSLNLKKNELLKAILFDVGLILIKQTLGFIFIIFGRQMDEGE